MLLALSHNQQFRKSLLHPLANLFESKRSRPSIRKSKHQCLQCRILRLNLSTIRTNKSYFNIGSQILIERRILDSEGPRKIATFQSILVKVTIQLAVLSTEQRLAKHPIGNKVRILTAVVNIARQFREGFSRFWRKVACDHIGQTGLTQKLQVITSRKIHELIEKHRSIVFLQVFMEQIRIWMLRKQLHFALENLCIRRVLPLVLSTMKDKNARACLIFVAGSGILETWCNIICRIMPRMNQPG